MIRPRTLPVALAVAVVAAARALDASDVRRVFTLGVDLGSGRRCVSCGGYVQASALASVDSPARASSRSQGRTRVPLRSEAPGAAPTLTTPAPGHRPRSPIPACTCRGDVALTRLVEVR